MKKLATLFVIVFAASIAWAEIPEDKEYVIKMAAYSIALDVRNESPTTANHYERVMLANRVITSPGQMPHKIAEISEAAQWGSSINWDAITDAQIKTAMIGVWNHIAIAEYGPDPVRDGS